ncbi:unnamed protein product [Prorocentrum cordatum]|uniref:AMP-dependent synthetase/ligase domain-containing protein n=1 Tax=Prorocentrum cordatum TaxID=2364126 RepID=A0ABN9SZF4_9DINO|nr:unnamed protein product [Polarella glacialis]
MSTRTQRVNPDISVDSQVQNVTVKCNLESVMSFTDGFNPSDLARPAIMSTDRAQAPLSYRELRGFLQTASLFPICGVGTEDVVALLLSNGPTLAVALLLVMSNCVAAPLEPTLSEEELLDAFQQLRIKHAVKLRQQKVPSVSIIKAAQVAGVSLHEIAPLADKAGIFVCPVSPGDTGERDFAAPALGRSLGWCGSRPSTDPVLALRTSGTTSKPKVVPLSLQGLHAGAVSIGQTLGLAETDVCLNVLPFTHIAGISCSLLSTLFMGGSVVCAPSFNVELFVHWLGELEPTWYFGVPTIHKALLLHCGATAPRHSLRLIRNAGASLPHADAQKLRVLFGCSVIPSYGMTECAPIAQCREGYALDAPGTVGSPAAVSVCIADEGGRVLPYGEDGEICIRGRVVTAGYLNNDEANSACFFGEADTEGFRWFRTGDVGHLDTTGFLYVTGRSKELIKRGGEQVSPYEVEDLLAKHHAVDLAIVFGVPNDFWGEEVAACVVAASVRTGAGTPLLAAAVASQAVMGAARREEGLVGQPVQVDSISPADLVQFLVGQGLSPSKLPRQFVIVPNVDSIPKTTTGKYLRSSLAKHFNLVAVDNEAAIGLQNNQSSISEPFGEGVRNKVIRPDKSVLGLRFVIALWVVFMHFGANFPAVIRGFRASSLSMEMFFVIAGFQLSATVTRPITDWCEFYKNRIVAVYPLYLLSILFGLPGLLFSLADTGRWAPLRACRSSWLQCSARSRGHGAGQGRTTSTSGSSARTCSASCCSPSSTRSCTATLVSGVAVRGGSPRTSAAPSRARGTAAGRPAAAGGSSWSSTPPWSGASSRGAGASVPTSSPRRGPGSSSRAASCGSSSRGTGSTREAGLRTGGRSSTASLCSRSPFFGSGSRSALSSWASSRTASWWIRRTFQWQCSSPSLQQGSTTCCCRPSCSGFTRSRQARVFLRAA